MALWTFGYDGVGGHHEATGTHSSGHSTGFTGEKDQRDESESPGGDFDQEDVKNQRWPCLNSPNLSLYYSLITMT